MAWIAALLHFSKDAQSFVISEPITLLDRGYVYAQTSPEASKLPQAVSKPINTDNVSLARHIALDRGITGGEWECLYLLGMRESGWRSTAQNARSTAYGLFQFLDSTWAGTGYQKSADPIIQIKAGLVYIENRYDTPCKAYEFQIRNNWY